MTGLSNLARFISLRRGLYVFRILGLTGNDHSHRSELAAAISLTNFPERETTVLVRLFLRSPPLHTKESTISVLYTMTASTHPIPIRSSLAAKPPKKCAPKRAVSFAKACKFDPPSRKGDHSDAVLQPKSKRKYQRRGSKTPAMLFLSKKDLSLIQQQSAAESQQQNKLTTAAPTRRLSLMSALKQNLERSCHLEPSKTIRRLSMDKNQNRGLSTLEFLTQM